MSAAALRAPTNAAAAARTPAVAAPAAAQRRVLCTARPLQQQHHTAQPLSAQASRQQQQRQRCPTSSSRVVLARASETAAAGSSGAPEGQMSTELIASMEAKIREELGAERVAVADVYGDGRHVSIEVVSTAFEGKNSMQRQRLVYKAIWAELQDVVHAVDAMTTKTPEEAAA